MKPIADEYYIHATCGHCGKQFKVLRRRAKYRLKCSNGGQLYCSRSCNTASQKVPNDKKAMKQAYDKARRNGPLRESILERKRQYHKKVCDTPEFKAARREYTKRNLPRHLERCRTEEYKAYKSHYDAKRRSLPYGDFAEVYVAAWKLDAEIQLTKTRT